MMYQDGKGVPRNQAESVKCACGLWANVGVSVEPGSIEIADSGKSLSAIPVMIYRVSNVKML